MAKRKRATTAEEEIRLQELVKKGANLKQPLTREEIASRPTAERAILRMLSRRKRRKNIYGR